MKMTIEVDCSPAEARAFLGLPDVSPINAYMVEEVKKRMDANVALLDPEALLKGWMALGGQATDQFQKLMTAASAGALGGAGRPK